MAEKEKTLFIEPIKRTLVKVELVGTSNLILNKKSRSYELDSLWVQTHDKGEKKPAEICQSYNLYEKLITSINWQKPIKYHDEDWSLYTEDEWKYYMNPKNNAPCITSQAIFGSMYEAFVSFGYKDSTGKNGTDVKRGVSFSKNKYPIQFTEVIPVQELVPTKGNGKKNVIAQHNEFVGWKCDIELFVADVAFPSDTVIDLLVTTGQFIGLSTQKHNGYGRFSLGSVEKTAN